MRLKLMTSLIAATTIFISVSPASAQSKPWISHDVLAENHRAYCDDIVAQNTRVDKKTIITNNNGSTSSYYKYSTQQAHKNSTKTKGSAGFNYLKIGGNIGGSQQKIRTGNSSKNTINKQDNTWNRDSHIDIDNTTITSETAGQNCGVFVQTAGQIEMNNEIQKTKRMQIEAGKQMHIFQQITNFDN
ncbi:hypothetical protein Riv7116_2958 [Rivularia sp. PCC 7116]|uniref:hypothetical protein n=1 Tax=Rivularia sp. PCC 7116 TaxID=373994 RepID=UPI00029F2AE7|nr:hypothetical protein [Rivularia sp. PCC 7116]AFY55439.1 hypothetical protein Riv7116_2958 [Rivularia sp. PCC 7116]